MMQGFGGDTQGYTNGDVKPEEEGPWYVKYGIRALGTAAGGLCLLLGAFNVLFSVFSPTCMIFAIWQMLVGFVVVTIEAPFCCAFVDHVQVFARKIEERPLIIKAAVYVIAPLPSIIFCFGFYAFIGGGCVVGVGVLYGMIGLGKKASREEMARNAHQTMGPSPSGLSGPAPAGTGSMQTSSESIKNPFSTVNISRDPIAAAAAEWAAQSASKFSSPPPAYNDIVPNQQPRQNWDQSFVNDASSRPTRPADPNNPFQ